jgi:hypothetical protein
VLDATQLKTFKISNDALKSDKLPARLKIFGWGEQETTKGKFRAGDKTAQLLSANQRAGGFERVALDFDHCTVPGTKGRDELIKAGQVPLIFGYGRVNPIPGDGIYLEEMTWTPLGVQHAKNFEDISPAILDDNGEVTLIHSVALTPNGAVKDLHFFSVNQNQTSMKNITDAFTCQTLAEMLGLKNPTVETLTASLGAVFSLSSFIQIKDGKIISLPGVIADGKVTVLSEIEPRVKKIEDAGTKAIATLSATIDGKVHTFSAEDVVKLVARVGDIEKKFTDGETAATEAERSKVIRLFSADGKVPKRADGTNYSADELKKLDVPTLQLLHANTPVTVPLSARTHTSLQDDKSKSFKDPKTGIVDMAALLEAENAQNP